MIVPMWDGGCRSSVSHKTAIAPPRPRTHWGPMILATSIRIGEVETSSVVMWYGGDLVAKACRTYCVRPAEVCRQHRTGWRKACNVPQLREVWQQGQKDLKGSQGAADFPLWASVGGVGG